MRNTYLLVAILAVVVFMAAAPSAQRPAGGAAVTQSDVIQVCLIESVVPMGIGRSKLFITYANGEVKEFECENIFSGVGINFGNIKQNQQLLMNKLNELVGQGYTIHSQTAGVFSQGDGNSGIFKTHYLLTK